MNAQTEQQHFDDLIQYLGISPTGITRPEPPDFTMTLDGRKIGVEHTLGIFEEVARGIHLRDKESPTAFLNLTSFRVGDAKRSNDVIRQHITHPSNPTVRWRPVAERLTEWVEKAVNAVDRKRRVLNKPHFPKFDENWLLVVDYPPWLDAMTVNLVISPLRIGLLRNPFGTALDFDRIFIRSGRFWLQFEGHHLTSHTVLAEYHIVGAVGPAVFE